MQNDLISRSILLGRIEDEMQCIERERQRYGRNGNIFKRNIESEKINVAERFIGIIKQVDSEV